MATGWAFNRAAEKGGVNQRPRIAYTFEARIVNEGEINTSVGLTKALSEAAGGPPNPGRHHLSIECR
jgi:hypothetical protein